jgi:putative sigma-54 modulation protein
MRLDLTGHNVDITPALRQLLSRKLSRLERVVQDAALSAQVVLTRERYRHVTDLALHARGERLLFGIGTGPAWAESMSDAVEKVLQQAQRVKGKWTARKRRAGGRRSMAEAPVEAPPPAATATAFPAHTGPSRVRYPVRRHTLTAAVARLEKAPEPFVLFRDTDSMRLGLVFRRRDGTVGLIEPEA